MLKLLERDKILHITCSGILVIITSLVVSVFYAVCFSLIIGLLKEVVWDKMLNRGTPDVRDVVANIVGIGLALIILSLFQEFILT